MSGTGQAILRYWPVIVLAAGLVSSGSVAQLQIGANAEEIEDISESVDENEEAINEIELFLRQRQGEIALDVQRIETEQKQQGRTLDEILLLLRELRSE